MTILTETYTLNNGVEIPKVGFGTWQIPNGQKAYDAVADALRAGYRHIDTAFAYGNEESVGAAIKDSGLARKDVFITSKLPAEVKDAKKVEGYFNQTIQNLGVDYLDLWLIHAPWPWNRIGDNHDKDNIAVWAEMVKLYKAGKIRAIGISNFNDHDIANLIANTDVVPAVDQIRYFAGFTQPKNTAAAEKAGMLVEAYSPLATGGLLDDPTITRIADKNNVSVAQLALRFCLQNGTLPLPKASSTAHIEANTNLDFEISDADMATLNALPQQPGNKTQH
ncbi:MULTISPECIES: aldo/keto reductase [Lacticaseibacillus]|uniref:Aldo/keto reductase n=2 Tax=Lacticaseibacillus TaxID=2759736 RepID=A0ABW4CKP9_9LACO|nr:MULTISPECIES: aldo/keto reductase [Lacticaseibacillus]